ncbi:DM13 domain-containing protein [Nonomuraea sp. NPDC050790]|uniref:DM13 domain-containing protein n=1 Tax=Nonomuraea sp. NPDC050790 TaxID=3364371 RepID=UPI0037B37C16
MSIFRRPVTWLVAGVALVVAAVGLYLFQPWRLFTTVTVDEALPVVATTPAATQAAAPTRVAVPEVQVLARGEFRSHEHKTRGTAKVLRLADGSRVLRIEKLDTSDGPDLRVWLTDRPVTDDWFSVGRGRNVELGDLKGNKGNANYVIPAGTDLDVFTSVTIWCKRFSVSFGAAALK